MATGNECPGTQESIDSQIDCRLFKTAQGGIGVYASISGGVKANLNIFKIELREKRFQLPFIQQQYLRSAAC